MFPRLAVWMDNGGRTNPTQQERPEGVSMTAAAKGRKGTKAALMTWYWRLGRPSFKAVVELVQSGASGMDITGAGNRVLLETWATHLFGVRRLVQYAGSPLIKRSTGA